MRIPGHILTAILALALVPGAAAQSAPAGPPASPSPATLSSARDSRIVAALRQVSAARIRANIEKLAGFGTRHTLSAADAEAVRSGRGIGAAREWIKQEFESYSRACGGCLEVEFQSFTQGTSERVPQPTEIVNVVATLRGTDPANAGRLYVVTGHYDSRNSDPLDATGDAPGANDDASGTAVSLECARVLSQHRFPATIVFMAVAGEEQGLFGSRYFARTAREKNLNLGGVLNNDIVGGNRTPGDTLQNRNLVRVFSEGIPLNATEQELRLIRATGGENDSASRQLARYIRDTARLYLRGPFAPMPVFRRDRYLRGGDHTPFNEFGYAAVRFTEFREDYNHQHQNPRTEKGIEYGDLPRFVDYEYVANVARLNAATLASLAAAPAPPANVRLLTKELENDSTLVWEPSPGGLATGYEVLWRSTTAPYWENVKPVGNVTRATLKMSKDNVILAVRAVGAQGHRSLAVVPTPER
ncbi:MAG TPA: M20/M25/M40 family metallo-hydrolase [Terriglobales bacterium]|nr:M20/M25/M40 family metallo-hydrolase [Terriglobales bacterium]